MKLIINGDDFGLSLGVSKGIIKAMKDGVLTDTSAMANMPRFEESAKLAISEGIKEMGVHLNITAGKPILSVEEVETIVDTEGKFNRNKLKLVEELNLEQVEKELRAQINRFLSTGLKINHFDGHHHFYMYDKRLLEIVIKLAREYNVPIRQYHKETLVQNNIKTTDYFEKDFFEEEAREDKIIDILSQYKNKDVTVEIMSHPAILDDELKKITSYYYKREEELKILLNNKLERYIRENNIKLISFSELKS